MRVQLVNSIPLSRRLNLHINWSKNSLESLLIVFNLNSTSKAETTRSNAPKFFLFTFPLHVPIELPLMIRAVMSFYLTVVLAQNRINTNKHHISSLCTRIKVFKQALNPPQETHLDGINAWPEKPRHITSPTIIEHFLYGPCILFDSPNH